MKPFLYKTLVIANRVIIVSLCLLMIYGLVRGVPALVKNIKETKARFEVCMPLCEKHRLKNLSTYIVDLTDSGCKCIYYENVNP